MHGVLGLDVDGHGHRASVVDTIQGADPGITRAKHAGRPDLRTPGRAELTAVNADLPSVCRLVGGAETTRRAHG